MCSFCLFLDRIAYDGHVRRSTLYVVGTTAAQHWTKEQVAAPPFRRPDPPLRTFIRSRSLSSCDWQSETLMQGIAEAGDNIRLPHFGKFLFALLLQVP